MSYNEIPQNNIKMSSIAPCLVVSPNIKKIKNQNGKFLKMPCVQKPIFRRKL